MHFWKPNMIRFMKNASEHTEYHTALAKSILSRLGPEPTICDAGCGLGYLSLELSKGAKKVIAVDSNPAPLAVLKENIAKRGITNIEVACTDLEEFTQPESICVMVYCFFGDGALICETAKRSGAKLAIAISSVKGHKMPNREDIRERLTRMGAKFEEERLELALDQPFLSKEDALLFFETYGSTDAYSKMSEEEFLSKLVEGEDEGFPLVLPIPKHLYMIAFNPTQLPELI